MNQMRGIEQYPQIKYVHWKYFYSRGTHNLIDVLDSVFVYELLDYEGEPIIGKFYEEGQSEFDKKDDDLCRMDLVGMCKYKSVNGGMYWILTAIEILSRYAFAIPVYVQATRNMTKEVTLLLKQFKDRFVDYTKLAQFEHGKEFYNVGVKESKDRSRGTIQKNNQNSNVEPQPDLNNFQMIDTNVERPSMTGLTSTENRKHMGSSTLPLLLKVGQGTKALSISKLITFKSLSTRRNSNVKMHQTPWNSLRWGNE